jgi:type II secretory pathway pseudopilin PulG
VKPRGFSGLEILGIIIALAVLVGAIAGAIHLVTSYVDGVRTAAEESGKATCDAAYKARDNTQLQAALARVKTLEDKAREDERLHVAALAEINRKLLEEKKNGQVAKDKLAADIRAGRLVRNSNAFQGGGCPANNGGSTGGAAVTPASGGDGSQECRLSDAAQASILAIGTDADYTAKLLASAQAVIVEDRKVCGVK